MSRFDPEVPEPPMSWRDRRAERRRLKDVRRARRQQAKASSKDRMQRKKDDKKSNKR